MSVRSVITNSRLCIALCRAATKTMSSAVAIPSSDAENALFFHSTLCRRLQAEGNHSEAAKHIAELPSNLRATQRQLLQDLLVTLVQLRENRFLTGPKSWHGLDKDVQKFLEKQAREPKDLPKNELIRRYRLLVAFHVQRDENQLAASAAYELALRLGERWAPIIEMLATGDRVEQNDTIAASNLTARLFLLRNDQQSDVKPTISAASSDAELVDLMEAALDALVLAAQLLIDGPATERGSAENSSDDAWRELLIYGPAEPDDLAPAADGADGDGDLVVVERRSLADVQADVAVARARVTLVLGDNYDDGRVIRREHQSLATVVCGATPEALVKTLAERRLFRQALELARLTGVAPVEPLYEATRVTARAHVLKEIDDELDRAHHHMGFADPEEVRERELASAELARWTEAATVHVENCSDGWRVLHELVRDTLRWSSHEIPILREVLRALIEMPQSVETPLWLHEAYKAAYAADYIRMLTEYDEFGQAIAVCDELLTASIDAVTRGERAERETPLPEILFAIELANQHGDAELKEAAQAVLAKVDVYEKRLERAAIANRSTATAAAANA